MVKSKTTRTRKCVLLGYNWKEESVSILKSEGGW